MKASLIKVDTNETVEELITEAVQESITEEALNFEKAAFETLSEIKNKLKEGKEVSHTPREILNWFGHKRRGPFVLETIDRTFKKLELETNPSYGETYLDSYVFFKLTNENHNNTFQKAKEEEVVEKINHDDQAHTIRRLKSANSKIVSVQKEDKLEKAITLMLMNQYSQLPVFSGEKLFGVISWESIGSRFHLGIKEELVSKFVIEVKPISIKKSLFQALSLIKEQGFALIEDENRKISGIITGADISEMFQTLSSPFLLIGEIESYIRIIIDKYVSKEHIKRIGKRDNVHELTFGSYVHILKDPVVWDEMKLNLCKDQFSERLDQVRKIRNSVVHFDPDGLSEEDYEILNITAQAMKHIKQTST